MKDIEKILKCTGFDWDQGNIEKNWIKHKVSPVECEEVFFNQPLIIFDDLEHTIHERRFAAFGVTDAGRLLAVIFTQRSELIRIISARDMNRKERKIYEEK
jgi:uncharacterized protein